MSTIIRLDNGKFRLFVKGAPDFLLPLCKYELTTDGVDKMQSRRLVNILIPTSAPIFTHSQEQLQKQVLETYGEKALRVILFAFRDFDRIEDCEQEEDSAVQGLTLQFFTGIQVL